MMINEQCIGYDMEESDSGIIIILSRQFPGGIKENHENPQSEWPASGMVFEHQTS
jgi:hypothetical protein